MGGCLVINLRGTNGSGKTTIVRTLMDKYGVKRVIEYDGPGGIEGYVLNNGVYVVGKYETPTGGCDGIRTQDEISERVVKYSGKTKVVIFEGLLISGLYGRYYSLSRKLSRRGDSYVWAFMDTSVVECVRRVGERRKAAGKTVDLASHSDKHMYPKLKSFLERNGLDSSHYNIAAKYMAVENCKMKSVAAGEIVIEVHPEKGARQIGKIIGQWLGSEESDYLVENRLY